MNGKNDLALARKPSSAVEKAAPGAKRILSGMVGDTLDLARKTESKEVKVSDAQLEKWYLTGEKYYFGEGVAKDAVEAVKWFRKAAEKNHAKAQCALGNCYCSGEGVTKDYVEALNWYRKAAEKNQAKAQCALGNCYCSGEGVTKDYVEALNCYRKAAEKNYAGAEFRLGYCYREGEGV